MLHARKLDFWPAPWGAQYTTEYFFYSVWRQRLWVQIALYAKTVFLAYHNHWGVDDENVRTAQLGITPQHRWWNCQAHLARLCDQYAENITLTGDTLGSTAPLEVAVSNLDCLIGVEGRPSTWTAMTEAQSWWWKKINVKLQHTVALCSFLGLYSLEMI